MISFQASSLWSTVYLNLSDLIEMIKVKVLCKQLKPVHMENIEGIFIEINLRKQKWLLLCGYNPHKMNAPSFFESVSKSIDKLISQFDNIIIMEDFNVEPHETSLKEFCEIYHLKNIVMQATCFKSLTNPTCIDFN